MAHLRLPHRSQARGDCVGPNMRVPGVACLVVDTTDSDAAAVAKAPGLGDPDGAATLNDVRLSNEVVVRFA